MLKGLLSTAIDLVYENKCGVCRIPISREEIVCSYCDPEKNLLLHSKLLNGPYCLKCAESIQEDELEICKNCCLYPLPIRYIRSVWNYTDTAESIICSYKYANSRSLSGVLAAALTTAIRSGAFPPEARYKWNLIVPIPSTNDSLKQRTFSPVGEITKLLSKDLGIPYSLLTLQVNGEHPPQASLSPKDRLKHLKRKYRVLIRNPWLKRILLVDDVLTSGASALGSTLALLQAGAETVDYLSICRSELFGQFRAEIYKKI
jgi:predicted amidophosphoribosyltransferase